MIEWPIKDMQRDVDMANLGLGFPLILGGHDHSVYVGEYGPDKCQDRMNLYEGLVELMFF